MRIVDLTLPVVNHMPGIPTYELFVKHPVKLMALTVKSEGQLAYLKSLGVEVAEDLVINNRNMMSKLTITSHVGTHIDAPRHFLERGASVDEIPLDRLVGEAVVIDLKGKGANSSVSAEEIEAVGVEILPGTIPVIHTGWTERMWGRDGFWEEMPYLKGDVGEYFAQKEVKALAMDCFPEKAFWRVPPEEGEFVGINHIKLLEQGIPLIQFVTNLSKIRGRHFLMVALPLKLTGMDGAPARVIALEG